MHVTRIYIEGYKRLTKFDLSLNDKVTVIVGDNESGKSSILEAIHLVLTRQYCGRFIEQSLDPYLFNLDAVAAYFKAIREGKQASPPSILIEAYLSDDDDPNIAWLSGRNNTKHENCPGLKLKIEIDDDHAEALVDYAKDFLNPPIIPIEFYKCLWRSFTDNNIVNKKIAFKSKTIDTSLPRMVRGPNRYVSQLVDDVLTVAQRRDLSLAYKKMRHGFSQEKGVTAINDHLKLKGKSATTKKLTVQVDLSSRSSWDSAIAAHLDDLPFDCAGKGEQCRIQMRLAIADSLQSRVLLIEEPENHLSHSNLNMLMNDIATDCADRQVIITTHSAFVLNKLGIDNLRLISPSTKPLLLSGLTEETKNYFLKLPGYDTLRLILSKHCILVEGPSDDLIVQSIFKKLYGCLPIEKGVDVISVGSLAFKRFLEIADHLNLKVTVFTDNDKKVAGLKTKYKDYFCKENIKVCFDEDEDHPTLEPQLLKVNSVESVNAILNTSHPNREKLLAHMSKHKTDCALKFFETDLPWVAPKYIENALQPK